MDPKRATLKKLWGIAIIRLVEAHDLNELAESYELKATDAYDSGDGKTVLSNCRLARDIYREVRGKAKESKALFKKTEPFEDSGFPGFKELLPLHIQQAEALDNLGSIRHILCLCREAIVLRHDSGLDTSSDLDKSEKLTTEHNKAVHEYNVRRAEIEALYILYGLK